MKNNICSENIIYIKINYNFEYYLFDIIKNIKLFYFFCY